MYPYDIIPGFDIYALCYTAALISALLILRLLGDKLGMEAKVYNLAVGSAVAAIVCGYLTSILAQSFYDYLETGTFRLGTGMTFYGGLLGGIIVFVLVYFIVGTRVFKEDRLHIRRVPMLENIAACCVTFAHATGRIGCLFAGCCHGNKTDAWYGIYHVNLGYRAVPTQLFEAIFLYALFVWLTYRVLHGHRDGHIIYLIAYGFWRFWIEFLRGDDRGASFIPGVTPSQLSALFFVTAGIVIYIVEKNMKRRLRDETASEG